MNQTADHQEDKQRKAAHAEPAAAAGAVATAYPAAPWEVLQQSLGNAAVSHLFDEPPDAASGLEPGLRSEMEEAYGADFGDVRVHPQSRLPGAVDARALTVGRDVFLGPATTGAGATNGREVLAHELAHVVQQRRATAIAPMTGRGDATERGAEAAARQALAGLRPSVQPAPMGPARDGPEGAGGPPAIADGRPAPAAMSASLSGLVFRVQEGTVYIPGPKRNQAMAIVINRLIGGQYRPGMEIEFEAELVTAHPEFEGSGAFSETAGTAEANEEVGVLTLDAAVAGALVQLLEETHHLRVDLTDQQRRLISLGIVSRDAFGFLSSDGALDKLGEKLPDWVNAWMFDRLMASRAPLLERTKATWTAFNAHSTPETADALLDAMRAILDALRDYFLVWEAIRDDSSLRENPERHGAFIGELESDPQYIVAFLEFIATQPSLRQEALESSEARAGLIERFQRFLGRVGSATGDEALTSAPSRANAPPNPAVMSRYPDSGPPLFDAALGTDYTFTMSINFPDVFEAFGNFAYVWERVKVPEEAFRGLASDELADQPEAVRTTASEMGRLAEASEAVGQRGELPPGTTVSTPTWGEVAGSRFNRAWEYAEADAMRAVDNVVDDLGPISLSAATLVGANNILRFAGTAIRLGLEMLFRSPSEQHIVFPEEGLYIIRCKAVPVLEGDEEFIRVPSVSYLPVYARDPDAMATRRARLAMAAHDEAESRVAEIRAALAEDPNQPQLEEELAALTRALGPVGDILEHNRDTVRASIADTELAITEANESGDLVRARALRQQLSRLEDELERLDDIIETREDREELHGSDVHPEPLVASFVSDDGQAFNLMTEAAYRPSTDGKQHYFVSDSTAPSSGSATGVGDNKTEAILAAFREMLEGESGYGRGRCSVWIDGRLQTIRIERSLGGLAMEAIESLTMIAAAVLVIAAPFTAGASLVLLLPVGVVGAIPSVYRIAARAEAETLRFDLHTVMDVVNIVGAAAGIMRPVATSLRFMRLGQATMIVGMGSDALGVLLIGAGVVDQLAALHDQPEGVRAARSMEIIGMALVNAGIMAGHALAVRAAGVSGGGVDLDMPGTVRGERAAGGGGEPGVRAGAGEPGARPEPGTRTGAGEPARGVGEADVGESAPAARTGAGAAPPHAAGMSLSDLRRFFFRALRRLPMAHDDMVELAVDPRTFEVAYRNAGGTGDLPSAFVDPVSGRIWVDLTSGDALTLFHESIHQYSIATGARGRFTRRFGYFLEEAITEWITRRNLGPHASRHPYDPHVAFLERMMAQRGISPEAVERAYLDGDIDGLSAAIESGFGGDALLTHRFLEALRNIQGDMSGRDAFNDAGYMLQTGLEPPDPARAAEPTRVTPRPDADTERTAVTAPDEEPTQITDPADEVTEVRPRGDETEVLPPDEEVTEVRPRPDTARSGEAAEPAVRSTTPDEPTRPLRRARPRAGATAGRRAEGATTPTPADRARRLFDRASDLYTRREFRRAIILFERVRNMPGAPESTKTACLYNAGVANLELGRFNTAIFYFEAYVGMADANVVRGRGHLAEARRRAGLTEAPPRVPAGEGMAEAPISRDELRSTFEDARRHYARREWGEALAAFERVRQGAGSDEAVRAACVFNIGLSNLRARRFATAAFYFERYLTSPAADAAGGRARLSEARAAAGIVDAPAPVTAEGPARMAGGIPDDEVTQPGVPPPGHEAGGGGTPGGGGGGGGGPAGPVVRATMNTEWIAEWPGDPRARVYIVDQGAYLRVVDIYRGSQPAGSGGEMVVRVMEIARGLPENAMPMRDRIRISNLQPEASVIAGRSAIGRTAVNDPVFRGVIEAIQRYRGRPARSVLYVGEHGDVHIELRF